MRLLTDNWTALKSTRRDALIAAAVGGPASIKRFAELIYGTDHSDSEYVDQTRAFQDLRERGYVTRVEGNGEHGNAKVHDITSAGRLLLDRNVVEPTHELKR